MNEWYLDLISIKWLNFDLIIIKESNTIVINIIPITDGKLCVGRSCQKLFFQFD